MIELNEYQKEAVAEADAHLTNTGLPSYSDLLAIVVRMRAGITGKDAHGCEWYESIEQDAVSELDRVFPVSP